MIIHHASLGGSCSCLPSWCLVLSVSIQRCVGSSATMKESDRDIPEDPRVRRWSGQGRKFKWPVWPYPLNYWLGKGMWHIVHPWVALLLYMKPFCWNGSQAMEQRWPIIWMTHVTLTFDLSTWKWYVTYRPSCVASVPQIKQICQIVNKPMEWTQHVGWMEGQTDQVKPM